MWEWVRSQLCNNDIAPGSADFDLADMPWNENSLSEDTQFLLKIAEAACPRSTSLFLSFPLWDKPRSAAVAGS